MLLQSAPEAALATHAELLQHPLIAALAACPQAPKHHPEGNVWNHTLLVVAQAAARQAMAHNLVAFMWAALLHDIGKPPTTEVSPDGSIHAHGHAEAGGPLAAEFLQDIGAPEDLIQRVIPLVSHHMDPFRYYKNPRPPEDRVLRRLAREIDLRDLLLLSESDHYGRGVQPASFPAGVWLRTRLRQLHLL